MKVRLTRLSGGKNLRTDSVEGECQELPRVGERFWMIAPGLEFGVRLVETSPVRSAQIIGREYKPCTFTTETGSTYSLEYLDAP